MRDLPSTLVVSLLVVEHLGGVMGRHALVGLGGEEMGGEGSGEMAAEEGGPVWECTL